MNKAIMIGNLTKAPELRTTQDGRTVCNFTLAVNRRVKKGAEHPEADYFRVTAWDQLGENCGKYLDKGKKCCVVGRVTQQHYADRDGVIRYNLQLDALDVEFLSPKQGTAAASDEGAGFVQVEDEDRAF